MFFDQFEDGKFENEAQTGTGSSFFGEK